MPAFPELAPDLVVEVMSHHDRPSETLAKEATGSTRARGWSGSSTRNAASRGSTGIGAERGGYAGWRRRAPRVRLRPERHPL